MAKRKSNSQNRAKRLPSVRTDGWKLIDTDEMSDTANEPLAISGAYFYKGKTRFLVRGVAYQTNGGEIIPLPQALNVLIDPIADDRLVQLRHDIALFKELGLNTIYVYSIDNTKPHDQAMKLLEEAGIYVLTTVATPSCTINRLSPYESYNADTLQSFLRTVDLMARYPNTLGIHAASELINNEKVVACAPLIVAVVRDLKKHMKLKNEATGQRVLPVGYDAGAIEPRDMAFLAYMLDKDADDGIDYWTCKGYLWAGESSIAKSGWGKLVGELQNVGIPMFFSEYGNTVRRPRTFDETRALFSPQMTRVCSGGCVYEFWAASNAYGLVQMLPKDSSAVELDRTEARGPHWRRLYNTRIPEERLIAERRDTEWGTLLVYKDFVNYRTGLEETRGLEPNTDHESYARIEEVNETRSRLRKSYPGVLENVGEVPESCVDWTAILPTSEEEKPPNVSIQT